MIKKNFFFINIFFLFMFLSIIYAASIFYLSSQSDLTDNISFLKKSNFQDLVIIFEDMGFDTMRDIAHTIYDNYDKILHFELYAGFGIVLYLTMHFSKRTIIQKYAVVIAFIIGVLYAITDEYHQSFVAGRSSNIADWMADCAGIAFSMITIMLFFRTMDIIEKFSQDQDKK
jgi:VanZ family protein